jgi:hypothetical protein
MRNTPILCLLFTTLSLNASAAPITYATVLSGAAEFPANTSQATGFARVVYDPAAHTLLVDTIFSNLTTGNTAAHIHCCVSPAAPDPTAGVATTTPTFLGFPTGATSGTFLTLLDLTNASSFRAGFISANGGTPASAELVLANGLAAGMAYLNIHSSTYPGGEIRGFLQPVPEPATLALVSLSLLAAAGRRLRRRR